MSAEETPINTPAVAAAFAKKNFVATQPDHLSLKEGDIVSVIDMGDGKWWKGKLTIALSESPPLPGSPRKGRLRVGYFPSECVQVFGEKASGPRWRVAPTTLASSPPPVVARRQGIVALLRSFLANRPARRNLKAQGILRERVFGCDLAEHLANSNLAVPLILSSVASAIEAIGCVDGIYRLSGRVANINRMRLAFDEGHEPGELVEWQRRRSNRSSIQGVDVHSLASLLKAYFRELPNPLFTYALCPAFESVVTDHSDPAKRVPALQALVQSLPPPHYRTAAVLMEHLWRVGEHGSTTGMHHQNLAIVWAPNLFRKREVNGMAECGGGMLRSVSVQAAVTAHLIRYHRLIFSSPSNLAPHRSLTNLAPQTPVSSGRRSAVRPLSAIISSPSPGKLIHLKDAQRKLEAARYQKIPEGIGLPDLSNRKCIDVNGGPDTIPEYHTVIDVPSKRRKSRRESDTWRALFRRRSPSPPPVEEESGAYGSLGSLHKKGWDARRLSKRRSSSHHKPDTPSPATPAKANTRPDSPDWKSQPNLSEDKKAGLAGQMSLSLGEAELEQRRHRQASPPPPIVPPPPKNYHRQYPHSLSAESFNESFTRSGSNLQSFEEENPQDYDLLRKLRALQRDTPGNVSSTSEIGGSPQPPPHQVREAVEVSPEWLLRNSKAPEPTYSSQSSLNIAIGPNPPQEVEDDRLGSLEHLEIGTNISPVRTSFSAKFREASDELHSGSRVSMSPRKSDPDVPETRESPMEVSEPMRESRLIEELKWGSEEKGSPSPEELAEHLPAELRRLYDLSTEPAPAAHPQTLSFETATESSFPSLPSLPSPGSSRPIRLLGASAQEDQYCEETLPLPSPTTVMIVNDEDPEPSSSISVIRFQPPVQLSPSRSRESGSLEREEPRPVSLFVRPVPAPRRSISKPSSDTGTGSSKENSPDPDILLGDERRDSAVREGSWEREGGVYKTTGVRSAYDGPYPRARGVERTGSGESEELLTSPLFRKQMELLKRRSAEEFPEPVAKPPLPHYLTSIVPPLVPLPAPDPTQPTSKAFAPNRAQVFYV